MVEVKIHIFQEDAIRVLTDNFVVNLWFSNSWI